MRFDFSAALARGAAETASPFRGYPPFHFVGGNIDEPSVPAEELARAVAGVLRAEGHALAKYGMNSGPQGYLPLREEVCAILARRAAMAVTPDQVLMTTGSLQAMDLVNAAFLEPGDAVVVEAGNYSGAIGRFRRLGARIVPVALDGEGMCMDALEAALEGLAAEGRRAKFIYTIPTIQNPTGSVLPVDRRRRMLALAADHGTAIFEDDCYADLVFSGRRPPAIQALDTDGRVIYCGTFSKTVAPALRVGYLVAPWPLMGHILPLKTDAGSGALEQMVLAEYLPGRFDAHVDALLPMLKAKADALCAALDEEFGAAAEYDPPQGGIYLWVTLPGQVDTDRLYGLALAEGVEINPGSQWTVDGAANRHRMRICFGHATPEALRAGVARLAEVCFREFGVPARGGNQDRG